MVVVSTIFVAANYAEVMGVVSVALIAIALSMVGVGLISFIGLGGYAWYFSDDQVFPFNFIDKPLDEYSHSVVLVGSFVMSYGVVSIGRIIFGDA